MNSKRCSSIFKKLCFILFLGSFSLVNAQIASWTYEPLLGTEINPTPNVGSGSSSVVNLGGGTIGSTGNWQATGMAGTGCGSQNGSNAWALNPFDPGSTNEKNGVQYNVSTVGNQNILVTWDQRFSNTSPNTVRLQYTTDGTTWTNFVMTTSNTTYCSGSSINANGCFENNAGDVYRRISVDMSSITTINNNSNFGIRLLAAFYQSTGQFRQCGTPTAVAGTTGTWRFDNVSISGQTPPTASVLSGTTSICNGASATINVAITGGTGPFTVVYSNGTTNTTVANYTSGAAITVTPTATTTYTIVSVKNYNGLLGTGNSGSAVITVYNTFSAGSITTTGQSLCSGGDPSIINTNANASGGDGNIVYKWQANGVDIASSNVASYDPPAGLLVNTTYTRWAKDGTCNTTFTQSTGSWVVTVNALPTVTFTTVPAATVCSTTAVTYATQTGKTNYVWTLPGTAGTDYVITAGGIGSTNSTVTLNWLTGGSKTVTVNYNNASGCAAATAATNTTTVNVAPVITTQPSTLAQTTCQGTPFSPLTVVASGSSLTYQWWVRTTYTAVSPPSGGAPVSGATSATFTPPSSTVGTNYYYVIVSSSSCTAVKSLNCTLAYTVTAPSVGGTIAGSTTLCSTANTTTLTLSGYTGSIIKWQSSTVANFSSNVSDIANTTNSYVVSNVSTATYYRAVIQNGGCSSVYSSTAQLLFVTTTWNGTLWDNGTPNSSTKVVFAANYTSTGDLQACSVQVNSNVVVSVQSGHAFSVTNDVSIDQTPLNPGAMIFEDTASLIQINNVVNTTPIYYKRNSTPMRKYDFTYWSSPVSNQKLIDFSPNTLVDKYFIWDANLNSWTDLAPSSTMNTAIGYIIRAPDVAPFNLTTTNVFNGQFYGIPNNGNITTPIVVTPSNDLNLIGNPYPSALDADTFLNYNKLASGGVLAGTMYFWTHNTPVTNYNYTYSDYASYNLTGGVGTIADSSPCSGCNNAIPDGKVAAGQSFFIQGLANGVAAFNNAMRFGVNTQFFKNNTTSSNIGIDKSRIWLDLFNDGGQYKQFLLGYVTGATNDYDNDYDGALLDSGNPILFYSILNDKKLCIQGRAPFNTNDIIPIGYKSLNAGTFTIKLSNYDGLFNENDLYLEDTMLHVCHNLKNGDYVFTTTTGTFDNRFNIRFTNTALSNSLFNNSNASVVVYENNNGINVVSNANPISTIMVYDLQGRIIENFKNINASSFVFNSLDNQMLIIKTTTSEGAVKITKFLNE
ncbi:hypothetical protein OX284_016875 [Flavobacterium sp. SUN046]|uniref:beta strand repeat-containing protein n=1 Tax=Flavobacterium sp. SUN046 TaxID=3002440 RepID=UPI002DB5EFB7|nr:hypothetical protein [Flavobacterium sp. SUN046]MEC4051111.1 hypothetical protein [Flavobacterium sp. SUN046]